MTEQGYGYPPSTNMQPYPPVQPVNVNQPYPPPQGNQPYPPPQENQPQQPNPYGQAQGAGQPPAPPGTVASTWMAAPQQVSNCPPGLEYLTQIDQLLVHQQVELLEAFTSFETNNKYVVKNTLGQQVYFAAEDTDCCTRNCCGNARPFDMKILDNGTKEVMHLSRPLRCTSCWCFCCLQKLEVCAPPGTVVGYVKQSCSVCYPQFTIENANEETILKISGPLCTWNLCGDVEFDVLSADGSTKVGKISKQWSGFAKEAFTDADNFGISFPMDLDVNIKAVMLGACFLIDFMFFERSGNQKDQNKTGFY